MSDAQIQPKDTALVRLVDVLERAKPQMKAALPAALLRHLTPDRMVRLVTTTLRRTPLLQQCTPISMAGAVIQACQLGLEVDGFLGEFWLTPRKIDGVWSVVGITGFRGLMKLARQSGEVDWILPHPVYGGDEFVYEYGSDPKLIHKPGPGPRHVKNLVATYCVARFRSGSTVFWVMTRSELDEVRALSPAKDSGPWVTHFTDMGLKTAVRRLCKYLPSSTALGRAVVLEELAEAGLPQGLDALVDPRELGLVGDKSVLDTIGEVLEKQNGKTTPAAPAGPEGSEGPSEPSAPAWAIPPPVTDPPVAAPATPEATKSVPEATPSPLISPHVKPLTPKPPRVRKPKATKWPENVEVPVGPPAPPPEPTVSPTGEVEVTTTTLYDLIGACQDDEALEEVSERIKASAVFLAASDGDKRIIRAAIIKQRAKFPPPA